MESTIPTYYNAHSKINYVDYDQNNLIDKEFNSLTNQFSLINQHQSKMNSIRNQTNLPQVNRSQLIKPSNQIDNQTNKLNTYSTNNSNGHSIKINNKREILKLPNIMKLNTSQTSSFNSSIISTCSVAQKNSLQSPNFGKNFFNFYLKSKKTKSNKLYEVFLFYNLK